MPGRTSANRNILCVRAWPGVRPWRRMLLQRPKAGKSCRFLQFPGYTPLRIVIYTAYRFPRRSISRVARMALGMVQTGRLAATAWFHLTFERRCYFGFLGLAKLVNGCGVDLNHRPLGYEGNSARHVGPNRAARCNKALEDLPPLLLRFASVRSLFTDIKRTVHSLHGAVCE